MNFHYDKSIDAFSIRFNEAKYAESDEVKDGIIFDYDARGKIIGIEILNASKNFSPSFAKSIAQNKISADLAITA